MPRDTSIESYERFKNSGKRPPQWMRIFYALPPDGLTRSELSDRSGIRLSSVCGRVSELIKEGLLYDDAVRVCSVTDEKVHVVKVVKSKPVQGDLYGR